MDWNRKVKKCASPKGVFFIPDDSDEENVMLFFKYTDYNKIREEMDVFRSWSDHDDFLKRNKLILVQ